MPENPLRTIIPLLSALVLEAVNEDSKYQGVDYERDELDY